MAQLKPAPRGFRWIFVKKFTINVVEFYMQNPTEKKLFAS